MKILFVADVSISNVIGGAERVLFEQSTRLASRGHSVYILTRKLANHKKYEQTIKGVTEYRFDCSKTNSVSFLYDSWKNSKKIFEILHRKNNFNCINFHQPFSALGVIHSSSSVEIPKIYTCHSLAFEEFESRNGYARRRIPKFIKLMRSMGYKKIEKNILSRSNKIVVLSNFTKDKLSNVYKIPNVSIQLIPGGVDLEKFIPNFNKNKIRKKLNIPSDKIILFTVRNLVKRMGIENLIIAFNDLIKQNAEFKLVIGGEGISKTGLIALARNFGIENHIHFVGFIPEDQLPSYYQMADLFVLPTKELEGFGLVTLEAMASGLPVVGTPVGGTKEILGSFDSSFLFKGTDPDSIAESIMEKYKLIKHNPQKWQQISQQCRKFVERNYSWEKNVDSLEELIARTLPN